MKVNGFIEVNFNSAGGQIIVLAVKYVSLAPLVNLSHPCSPTYKMMTPLLNAVY